MTEPELVNVLYTLPYNAPMYRGIRRWTRQDNDAVSICVFTAFDQEFRVADDLFILTRRDLEMAMARLSDDLQRDPNPEGLHALVLRTEVQEIQAALALR